jgi:hypothetical protein
MQLHVHLSEIGQSGGLLFAKNRASFSGAVAEKMVLACKNSTDNSACVNAEFLV